MCTNPSFAYFVFNEDDGKYVPKTFGKYYSPPSYLEAFSFGASNPDGSYGLLHVPSRSFDLRVYDLAFDSNSVLIPCGRCIECFLQRSSEWSLRLMHEAAFHESSCFLTLTYSDENLPFTDDGFPTLYKRHLQLFFKRLRKRFPSIKFRYYACGEYGDTTLRPHYHVVLFGYDFSKDRRLYKLTSQKHKLYNSDVLTNLWGLGHCVIGDLTDKTASYVARYVSKKIFLDFDDSLNGSRLHSSQVPEFSVMSNRPGIGYLFMEKYGKQFLEQGYVLNSKKRKCLIPRYYRKKLADLNPDLYADYEAKFLSSLDLPKAEDLYRRHQYRQAIHKQSSRSAI